MATISFDREIRIKPEDMDRFLDILEKKPRYTPQYIDVDKELEESRKILEKYYSHRSQKKLQWNKSVKIESRTP